MSLEMIYIQQVTAPKNKIKTRKNKKKKNSCIKTSHLILWDVLKKKKALPKNDKI